MRNEDFILVRLSSSVVSVSQTRDLTRDLSESRRLNLDIWSEISWRLLCQRRMSSRERFNILLPLNLE